MTWLFPRIPRVREKSVTRKKLGTKGENSSAALKLLCPLCRAAQNIVPWHLVDLHPSAYTQCCICLSNCLKSQCWSSQSLHLESSLSCCLAARLPGAAAWVGRCECKELWVRLSGCSGLIEAAIERFCVHANISIAWTWLSECGSNLAASIPHAFAKMFLTNVEALGATF